MVLQKKRGLKYPVKIRVAASGTGTDAERGVFVYDSSGARVLLTMTAASVKATLVGTAYGVGK